MSESLSERVRIRVREEMQKRNLSQSDVAGLVEGLDQSKVSRLLSGEQRITLDELEYLAFAISVPPSELIRDRGMEWMAEMTPTEMRILEHYRRADEELQRSIRRILQVSASPYIPDRYAKAPKELGHPRRKKPIKPE
jgi:transcriptional regulator with XRE-family HTH domain